jgi:hypothetical protein
MAAWPALNAGTCPAGRMIRSDGGAPMASVVSNVRRSLVIVGEP